MGWSLMAVLACIVLMHLVCNNVSSQDTPLKELIKNGMLDFSVKLNQVLYKTTQQNGNVLHSPMNIYYAMLLVQLGADGNTRNEMTDVLGLPKNDTKIQQTHEALSQILREIENTTAIDSYGLGPPTITPTVINIANGIFVQNGITLLPSYVSQVQSYYKGQVSNLDFAKESIKATDTVNQFVSKSTNGTIPQLFTSPISADTSVLLAACLYFKGTWEDEFYEGATKEENFNTGSGNVLTKMMTRTDDVPYINLPDLQLEAISLAYAGGDASIYFVLPRANQTLDNVVQSLNAAILQRIVKEATSTYVSFTIPQLNYKWSSDINNPLETLGIKDLFSNNATLNNMVSNMAVKVSQVTHAAQIQLNEKCTEASAVTIIKIVPMSAPYHPDPPIPFRVNRPFTFFIHHRKTGTILFWGAVHNPNGVSN